MLAGLHGPHAACACKHLMMLRILFQCPNALTARQKKAGPGTVRMRWTEHATEAVTRSNRKGQGKLREQLLV